LDSAVWGARVDQRAPGANCGRYAGKLAGVVDGRVRPFAVVTVCVAGDRQQQRRNE
jgi:hypothetical protein